MGSLDYLLKNAVPFRSAPELFCLDLYRYFDLDQLSLVASPADVKRIGNEAVLERGITKKYSSGVLRPRRGRFDAPHNGKQIPLTVGTFHDHY